MHVDRSITGFSKPFSDQWLDRPGSSGLFLTLLTF